MISLILFTACVLCTVAYFEVVQHESMPLRENSSRAYEEYFERRGNIAYIVIKQSDEEENVFILKLIKAWDDRDQMIFRNSLFCYYSEEQNTIYDVRESHHDGNIVIRKTGKAFIDYVILPSTSDMD